MRKVPEPIFWLLPGLDIAFLVGRPLVAASALEILVGVVDLVLAEGGAASELNEGLDGRVHAGRLLWLLPDLLGTAIVGANRVQLVDEFEDGVGRLERVRQQRLALARRQRMDHLRQARLRGVQEAGKRNDHLIQKHGKNCKCMH